MTTKRTAIRGRLAVRRAANRPPWSRRKLGHGAIVAPLAATVAATLAATVAIGVGVALARAERDRRWARARRARDRQFALLAEERLTDGLRRMALTQLDLAIELLGGDGGAVPRAIAVHETRKSLKRLRALMALLRGELGERQFAHEDAVLRGAGLRLAGARDAEVLVSTLDELVRANRKQLAHRRGVARLRSQLVAERDTASERAREDAWTRAQVVADLRSLRGRVQAWSLPHRDGIESVEVGPGAPSAGSPPSSPGGRRPGGNGRAMHRWRKRVKDLRYAAAMLDRRAPGHRGKATADGENGGSQRRSEQRTDAGRIRRLARRADELGELLGEEHDLALLAGRLKAAGSRGGSVRLEVGAPTRRILLKLIARRRRRLSRKALQKGKRLYRPNQKQARGAPLGDAHGEGAAALAEQPVPS